MTEQTTTATSPHGKRLVRYFVSYTRLDENLPGKLLAELAKHFGSSRGYQFAKWQDTDILLGKNWHDEIQAAIHACDFGLLLVSPAFLSREYITQHELPHYLRGPKPCIPVGLCPIDPSHHDLCGLEALQIFWHTSPDATAASSFAECDAILQAGFALKLFQGITRRLDTHFAGQPVVAPFPPSPNSQDLRIAPAVKDDVRTAISIGNQTASALEHKDWPGAEKLAWEALTLSEALEEHVLIATNNYHLAKALVRQGKKRKALPYAKKAVALFTAQGRLARCGAGWKRCPDRHAASTAQCPAGCRIAHTRSNGRRRCRNGLRRTMTATPEASLVSSDDSNQLGPIAIIRSKES